MSQQSQPGGTPDATPGETPGMPGAEPGGSPPVWSTSHQQAVGAPGPGGFGTSDAGNSAWVTGGVTFAGILMVMNGIMAVLQGIAALSKDDVYATVDDYVYKINLTGWGWILLVLGVVAALAGLGVLKGATWARLTGILLASLSMIVQFMFLPYAPIWGVIMISIDFFVIWALAVYRPAGTHA